MQRSLAAGQAVEARYTRAPPPAGGRVKRSAPANRKLEAGGQRSKLPHASAASTLLDSPTKTTPPLAAKQQLRDQTTELQTLVPQLRAEETQRGQEAQPVPQPPGAEERPQRAPRRKSIAKQVQAAAAVQDKVSQQARQTSSSKGKGNGNTSKVSAAAAAAVAALPAASGEEPPSTTKKLKRRSSSSSKSKKEQLPSKEGDIMRWFSQSLRAAEHAHRSFPGKRTAPTLGHAVRAPMQEWLSGHLDYMGFDSRPFPQLLPLDLLLELGVGSSGSQGQGAAAEEASNICTSHFFARWAASSRDSLPVLASQWHDVDSWDLHNPGLLLHESHAAHEWEGTAQEHAQAMISLYEQFAREVAALPVVVGRRSPSGSFSGAAASYTAEVMVGGGRALQVGQSHHLADNFSRALGASYTTISSDTEEGEEEEDPQFMSQMGSGLRSSLLGGLALVHGDAAGLALPPTLAPVQVVITPVLTRSCDKRALADEAERIRTALVAAGVRAAVDNRRLKPGVRFKASEQMGVPLRIEVGPADIKSRTCVIARRSLPGRAGKLRGVSTEAEALVGSVLDLLGDAQSDMQAAAAEALCANIVDVSSFMEMREVIEAGKWARGPWAGSLEDEVAVYEETGATLRCFPLQQPVSMWSGWSTCLYSGYQASEVAIFARAL